MAEPRARAGKNVGKMNFNPSELTQFLIAHGDSRTPLPETIRVLDEVVTEFIQGISFEATRVAQLAGRQKVKYEDFEFAMRRNPTFLGKVQDNFERKKEVDQAKKLFNEDEFGADAAGEGGPSKRGRKPKNKTEDGTQPNGAEAADEELGEADDDIEAEPSAVGSRK